MAIDQMEYNLLRDFGNEKGNVGAHTDVFDI